MTWPTEPAPWPWERGTGSSRRWDRSRLALHPPRIGVPGFLAPKSLGEVKDLARMIALAEWAPDCYRDIDGNYLQPKIELAILHGATVGLGPIAAVHAIAVIGGTPSIWGDGALSVIEHSGLLEDMVEDYEVDDEEGLTAICTMKRRHRATPIVTRFSMAMAERAGLTRSKDRGRPIPSGCCACAPAPGRCATPSPMCCAGCSCAKRSRIMSGVGEGGHSALRRARAARREACASTRHRGQASQQVLMARAGRTIGRARYRSWRADAARTGPSPSRFPRTSTTPSLTLTAPLSRSSGRTPCVPGSSGCSSTSICPQTRSSACGSPTRLRARPSSAYSVRRRLARPRSMSGPLRE